MTQQEHVDGLKKKFSDMMQDKYIAGAKEHGGNLWEKTGLLDSAIEEVIDLATYLLTLKEQQDVNKE